MTTFEVRPVAKSDLPSLMGLDHSGTTEYVWQLELRRDTHAPQIAATFREVRLPRPVNLAYPNNPFSLADEWPNKALMLAAISGKDAVGYLALFQPKATVAWVTDLVVAPRWRRQGIAGQLLASAQRWGATRGVRQFVLEMQSKNHPAIRLAQKHGYDFCGYNDQYYSTQDIALFFARAL